MRLNLFDKCNRRTRINRQLISYQIDTQSKPLRNIIIGALASQFDYLVKLHNMQSPYYVLIHLRNVNKVNRLLSFLMLVCVDG